MPTGYTADIQNGISFTDYALNCARAFGALIMMRDEPHGIPIPEFEPSQYHKEQLAVSEKALADFRALSDDERAAMQKAEYDAAVKSREDRIKEKKEIQAKYERMLDQVNDWTPPSDEHKGLHDFMRKQIEDSIDFDCSTKYMDMPEMIPFHDWVGNKMRELIRNVDYHKTGWDEEVKRTDDRNKWVSLLKQSLTPIESE